MKLFPQCLFQVKTWQKKVIFLEKIEKKYDILVL